MATENESRPIKVVIVGDGLTGKSCLVLSYLTKCFPTEYVATVFENYAGCFTDGENTTNISFWDTPGQDHFERLRPLSYPGTTVFLMCFSVGSRASFSNVSYYWLPEVRHYCGRRVPIVLVGTKTDLREELGGTGKKKKKDTLHISTNEGIALAKSEKLYTYVECSAKLSVGCDAAVRAAVKAGRNYEAPTKRNSCCTIS